MALIDTINKMKQQNLSNQEIIKTLEEQGYSPEEINSSLSQANIVPASPQPSNSSPSQQNMQPSLMASPQSSQPHQQPITQEVQPEPPQQYQEPQTSEETYQNYNQAYYPEQGYEQYLPSTSDTMAEIAEEIVEEKLTKLKNSIGNLSEFKIEIEDKLKNLHNRVRRIENIIDKLQLSILKKISIYGENLEDIKSEITKTQDSFSKILNPLVDKARKVTKTTKKSPSPKPTSTKSKDIMTHFLRR